MVAGKYDIFCDQGATLEVDFTILKPGACTQPLYGLSAHLGIKRHLGDSGATVASWSTTTGELTILPETGVIQLNVSAAATAAINTSGVFDLFLQSGTGDAHKILEGRFVMDEEVTR